jgi:predicted RNA-binding Zn ribbon-like protein
MRDPRPLTGEPLPLDLVNTEWVQDGVRRDLLADSDGMRLWLGVAGHDAAPVTDGALTALREARAAIRAVLEHRGEDAARDGINAVLARGRLRERLGPAGPERVAEVADADWRVPWIAAQALLELLRDHPERVRTCANHACILHFYDTSRSGRRQWCSMAGCGNRAKARRHYARSRGDAGF